MKRNGGGLPAALLARFADGQPRTADEMAEALGRSRVQIITAVSGLKRLGHPIASPGTKAGGGMYRIAKK